MADFDPYHRWLGIPPTDRPVNFYRLLGLATFESNVDAIRHAADKQQGYIKQLAVNQYADIAQPLLNEIAKARLCLLDNERRQRYDTQLKAELAERSRAADAPAPAPIAAAVSSGRARQYLSRVPDSSNTTRVQLTATSPDTTWIVGADSQCDIVINQPGVSKVHCQLQRRSDKLFVRDLHSTNGTFLNLDEMTQRMPLSVTDFLTLGQNCRLKLAANWHGDRSREVCVYVGRHAACELSIDHASVSSLHALLIANDDQVTVRDLHSTNGTRVVDHQGQTIELERGQERTFDDLQALIVGHKTLPFGN